MASPRIYTGNHTLIRRRVVDQKGQPVDLSGATLTDLKIVFVKPDGITRVEVTATQLTPATDPLKADGEDGRFEYQATGATFDVDGRWESQVDATLPDGRNFGGDVICFPVYARI